MISGKTISRKRKERASAKTSGSLLLVGLLAAGIALGPSAVAENSTFELTRAEAVRLALSAVAAGKEESTGSALKEAALSSGVPLVGIGALQGADATVSGVVRVHGGGTPASLAPLTGVSGEMPGGTAALYSLALLPPLAAMLLRESRNGQPLAPGAVAEILRSAQIGVGEAILAGNTPPALPPGVLPPKPLEGDRRAEPPPRDEARPDRAPSLLLDDDAALRRARAQALGLDFRDVPPAARGPETAGESFFVGPVGHGGGDEPVPRELLAAGTTAAGGAGGVGADRTKRAAEGAPEGAASVRDDAGDAPAAEKRLPLSPGELKRLADRLNVGRRGEPLTAADLAELGPDVLILLKQAISNAGESAGGGSFAGPSFSAGSPAVSVAVSLSAPASSSATVGPGPEASTVTGASSVGISSPAPILLAALGGKGGGGGMAVSGGTFAAKAAAASAPAKTVPPPTGMSRARQVLARVLDALRERFSSPASSEASEEMPLGTPPVKTVLASVAGEGNVTLWIAAAALALAFAMFSGYVAGRRREPARAPARRRGAR